MANDFGTTEKAGSPADSSHPFIAAKPPTTDQLTYLTLLEYNLTADNVQVLQNVLIEDLNANGSLLVDIGWDLIAILLPYVHVEAARECLYKVARHGNPRECALKVEQGLRRIDWDFGEDEGEDEDENDQTNVHPAFRTGAAKDPSAKACRAAARLARARLPGMQFSILVDMLSTLHARIKTKQPSRFIATTLSAVLASLSGAPPTEHADYVEKTLALVTSLKNTQAPALPPRGGSISDKTAPEPPEQAPDPEADDQSTAQEPLDAKIQRKLLQSFVTHVTELWMSTLDGVLDEETAEVPGLAWAIRFQEKEQPRMNVPDRRTVSQRSHDVESLRRRDELTQQLCDTASTLGLTSHDLFEAAATPSETGEAEINLGESDLVQVEDKDDDEPPEKPEDVPLSQNGCLFLFAHNLYTDGSRSDASTLTSKDAVSPRPQIFPDVANLMMGMVGSPEDVMFSTAAYTNALLDAVLFCGLAALSDNAVGDPEEAFPDDTDAFTRFLQTTSLVSANAPNPSIRYCAHVLTATVLRSHPTPAARLSFIRDTLENAPVDLLKAEAVGWLKGEIVEANIGGGEDSEHNIFRTTMALDSLSVHLYPDLQTLVPTVVNSSAPETAPKPTEIFAEAIKPRLPFFLAVLNFHFLLLSLPAAVRERLDILELHKEADVATGFLTPLREVSQTTNDALKKLDRSQRDESWNETMSDVMLLQQAIEQVERRVVAVAKEGR